MSEEGAGPAPLIVTALFGPEDFAWLDGLRRRHFPPERNLVPAHCTLFHHLPPGLGRELKQRLSAATRGIDPPRARIGGVIDIGRGVAFRIESPELEAIRDDLADAFAPLLTPQDSAGWRPHITIQNKVDRTTARALLARMQAEFEPCPLRITGLASWWYRGGPWEQHSRHMFA
ncbi:2'-5' RNA ligase family protein [Stakelama tenebrarum]|uniref:2'-5' RNA ligase family protein n=1 Tax=Stakelama tenebrarum TaxID=2711215 RepID=A0A6G6Y8P3_9SPHN|nr:2'-5' RNA ligase family protein [Sphingosinithalassobacter tenebrarum]QIG80943.1 2'-5' RNA ligase family protein [Sphingosinithalassobacter tenebrarum]